MHACAALLHAALELAASERAALSAEDLDKAEMLAARRGELLQEAWRQREGYDEADLRELLLLIEEAQTGLMALAESLRQKYREQQSAGRKQAKYFTAERRLHEASRKAFYLETLS